MTAKQYYKQTSDMAYPLDTFSGTDCPNRVVANIAFTHGETQDDAIKFLNENDFFSLPNNFDFYDIDIDNIELELRFHYDVDSFDCFKVNVCDVIDCRDGDNGRFVLSCNGYSLIKSCPPPKDVLPKGVPEKSAVATNSRPAERKSIFDLFDDIVGCSSCLGDLFNFPSFPKFPDISKMIDETRKNIEDGIENRKGDDSAKFYNFSCKIDPDGNVHIKRSSNDGTVEKSFKLGDKTPEAKKEKKISIMDDPKTVLRNLVK